MFLFKNRLWLDVYREEGCYIIPTVFFSFYSMPWILYIRISVLAWEFIIEIYFKKSEK